MKRRDTHTHKQWLDLKASYGDKCAYCRGKSGGIRITKDHIIPRNKGGSNWIDNIAPACRFCNSKKWDRILTDVDYAAWGWEKPCSGGSYRPPC